MSIDAMFAHDAEDAVVLVLAQPNAWDRDGKRLEDLQARLNEYLAFALDGELARRFPALAERKVVISIEYAEEPGPQERRFFDIVREQLGRSGVELRLDTIT
jgi:hypothetical protein